MMLSAPRYVLSASCNGVSWADVADCDLAGGDEAEEGGSIPLYRAPRAPRSSRASLHG